MKNVSAVIVLLLVGILSSCIPHKDTVYYQNKSTATDTINLLVEQQKPYRVQINDILNIQVKALDQENVAIFNPIGDANLNASSAERAYFDGFTVDTHGNIRVPTLGYINVLGRTTEEIQKMIEEQLLVEQFKETANIFVTVKLAGLRYSASGEVGSPGTQTLFQERVNIYQAIANVGEITDFGNRKDVHIIRQYPQGQQIHHLDLTDVQVMESPFYFVQPNDMIYVPPLKQKAIGLGTNGIQTFTTILAVITSISSIILLTTRL
ncbi:polysaccharide biosynthesis/export family protein [Aegicerativicinus sediminis]|uniref:polysaccharide biosynthesis/export family protein n=1 Tax=Aegicerativicinus sediminis TaxID=2893202 RepID=UPI001E352685|nr:polysaccharide biosynthesis/export family protein [Aegicerativicinus sediminis]